MVNAGWPTKADRGSKHIDHPRKLLFAGHSVRHWSLEGLRTHRGIAHRVSDLGVAQVTAEPAAYPCLCQPGHSLCCGAACGHAPGGSLAASLARSIILRCPCA